MNIETQVKLLSTFTNRDHAGRHFTERYSDSDLAWLESAGLIAITRPIHEPTGIPYDHQYWRAEVTPEGVDLVESRPEFCDPA